MGRVAGLDSGAEFARLRNEAGLSQRRLASLARVDVSSLRRVEQGGHVTREVRDSLVFVLGEETRALIKVRHDHAPTDLYLARRARSESGRDAAKRAGVPKDVIHRAERGLGIRRSNALKIAAAYDFTPEQFMALVVGRREAA